MHVLRRENGIDFLSFRLWIGVWMALFLLSAVALDLSALIRYITRFTEESFAVLISVIFMYESFVNVAEIWLTHPLRMGTAAAGAGEQCYCGVRTVRQHQTTDTSADNHDDRVRQLTAVTVQLNENRLNNSLYRLNTSSRFPVPLVYFLGQRYAELISYGRAV